MLAAAASLAVPGVVVAVIPGGPTGDVVITVQPVAPMVLAQPYRTEPLATGRRRDVPGRRTDAAALRARRPHRAR